MKDIVNKKQVNQGFYAFYYKGGFIVLDINTSRCLEMTPDALDEYMGEEGRFSEERSELDKLSNIGVFKSSEIPSGLTEDDLVIEGVHLGVHTRCNLSCRYCYGYGEYGRSCGGADKSHKESMEQAVKIINRCIEKFVDRDRGNRRLLFNLSLTGEILLDLDLLRELKKHCMKMQNELGINILCCGTGTNATLLNSATAQDMWELSDMTGISISIDGPKYIHDTLRVYPDGKGTYDDIESNIRLFNIRWRATAEATLTGEFPHVTEIFTHLFDLGFDSIRIKPIRTIPDDPFAINRGNIEAVKEEYTKFVQFLLSQDDRSILSYLSVIDSYDMFGRFFFRLLKGERSFWRCNYLLKSVGIDFEGNVYPCVSFFGMNEFNIGNIFNDSMDWNVERMRYIEKMHILEKRKECKVCWARNLCGGGCSHSAWLSNKSMEAPDDAECRLTRHLIELSMIMLSEINKRPEVMKALISRFINRSPQSVVTHYPCMHINSSPLSEADEWKRAGRIRIDRREQYRGFGIYSEGNSFSGNLKVLWDNDYFYIRVDLEDQKISLYQKEKSIIDEMRIYFAVVDEASAMQWKYAIALRTGRPELLRMSARDTSRSCIEEVEDATASVERKGNITVYQAAVPWNTFGINPSEGGTYRFNAVIYDDSHPFKTKTWYELGPGLVVEADPQLFGKIRLEY